MPLAGAVSRVSILYLRCSLRRGGVYGVEGDQGEVTFNSLFEMPSRYVQIGVERRPFQFSI